MNFTSIFNTKRQSVRNSQSTVRNSFKRSLQLETLEERQLLTVAMDMVLDASDLNVMGTSVAGVYSSPAQLQAEELDVVLNAENEAKVIDLTEEELGPLPEGQTEYVIEIDKVVALEQDTTYQANGISVVYKLVGDGAFDETNGTLSLTAINDGRIRMIKGEETLYDSAWEYRGMSETIKINTLDDLQSETFDTTDGVISLREAVNYAGNTYREYAEGKTEVTLSNTLEFTNFEKGEEFVLQNDLKLEKEVTIDGSGLTMVNTGTATLKNISLEDMTITNTGTLTLSGIDFTGEYDITDVSANLFTNNTEDSAYDSVYALLHNEGQMTLEDCNFLNVDLTWKLTSDKDYDNYDANVVGALVANMNGQLDIIHTVFRYNTMDVDAVHGDVHAAFSTVYATGDGTVESGWTKISRSVIGENTLDAYSKHGDVTAISTGLLAENAQTVLFSTLMYKQNAYANTKYGLETTTANCGLCCSYEDTQLINCTILDTIVLERSEALVENTIYNKTEFNRSGFVYDDDEGYNYCLVGLEDWTEVFPYWDSETQTFTDDDYRIYAANTNVVNAGNNDFINAEVSRTLNIDMSLDLTGKPRIVNKVVDIGAVESLALPLDEDLLDPSAQAQKDEAGLTTIDFSWGSEEVNSDRVTYIVRYRLTPDSNDIPDGALSADGYWTVIDTPFNKDNLPKGVTYDATTMRYTWAVSGLTAGKTLYDFEVYGYGDDIDFLNSTDWVRSTENTREQISTPKSEQAAPQSETAVTITWVTDERAVAYEISYYPTDDPDAVKTIKVESGEGGVTLAKIIIAGKTVWGAAYTINGLEESTEYTVSWRSLSEYGYTGSGDDYVLNSNWVTASTSTKTVLETPELDDEYENSLTTLDISWSDSGEHVSQYIVMMYPNPDTNDVIDWDKAKTFETTDTTLHVENLNPASTYTFRVMAKGDSEMYMDSGWSTPKEYYTLIQLDDPTIEANSVFTTEFTTDTLKVEWELPAEADSYKLYMLDGMKYKELTAENFPALTLTFDTANNNVLIKGLDASTKYSFAVQAFGNEYIYADSTATTSATTPTAVDAPVLNWEDNEDGTATITWENVEHTIGYNANGKDISTTTYTTDEILTDTTTQVDVYAHGNQSENYASSTTSTLYFQRLETPENIVATATSTTSIKVTWDAVKNANYGYSVTCDTLPEGAHITVNSTSCTATVTGLETGTDYNFEVVANGGTDSTTGVNFLQSDANEDSESTWRKLSIDTLTGKVQDTTINVEWSCAEGDEKFVDNYEWQYRKLNGTWSEKQQTTDTKASFDGDENTVYEIRVMANSTQGKDGNSDWETTTVSTWNKLEIELEADPAGTQIVTASWNEIDVEGVKYQLFYIKGEPTEFVEKDWIKVDLSGMTTEAGVCSIDVDSLQAETTYTFALYATAEGYIPSDVSKAVVTTLAVTPLTDDLHVEATVDNWDIKLDWDDVDGAVNYNVVCEWTTPDGEKHTVTRTTTDNTTTFKDLDPGTTYTFTVTANPDPTDVDHKAAVSDPVNATTDTAQLDTPNGDTVATNTSINVTWDSVDNASGYKVKWRENGTEDWNESEVLPASDDSYLIDGVKESTLYDIQIIAVGDGTHYTDSEPEELQCSTITDIELDAVVVTTQSEPDATEKPASVDLIDEWTHAYLELWTSDVTGLIKGTELTTTFEINENFKVDSVIDLPGTTVTVSEDETTVTITIDATYAGDPNNDSMVAQILIVPQSQANGNPDGNGLQVEGSNEKLVKYNDTWITDVKPVIYDLDDNGVIDSIDEANYAAHTDDPDTCDPLVDFNKDGHNCDSDLAMLTRNKGKSQAGDWSINYANIKCNCGKQTESTPTTASAKIVEYAKETDSQVQDDFEYEFALDQAERLVDTYPHTRENNRMTSGVILKKSAKDSDEKSDETTDEKSEKIDGKAVDGKLKTAMNTLDEILSAEDIDWRYEA